MERTLKISWINCTVPHECFNPYFYFVLLVRRPSQFHFPINFFCIIQICRINIPFSQRTTHFFLHIDDILCFCFVAGLFISAILDFISTPKQLSLLWNNIGEISSYLDQCFFCLGFYFPNLKLSSHYIHKEIINK